MNLTKLPKVQFGPMLFWLQRLSSCTFQYIVRRTIILKFLNKGQVPKHKDTITEYHHCQLNALLNWVSVQFYEDLQDLPELTPQKDVFFIIGDWNAKEGSQDIPGVTGKFGLGVQNKAGQRLIEFCQENTLVIASTLFQQHKRRLYTWTSPDGQLRNQIDYILCIQRWRSSIQSTKTRPGADCGSDHELLIAKFRLKLKKVGKTTRLFRYDLNQIPYHYTVDVTNT